MLWEQISMLWEQDIILREQNIFFSRMTLISHRIIQFQYHFIQVCYYYMLLPTRYHWNISFQNKLPSKYVAKNARSVTHFVWQTFLPMNFKGLKFKTAHIQCKQSVLPRSLELREDFQTCRWPYIWKDNDNRVVSHIPGLHPINRICMLSIHIPQSMYIITQHMYISIFS
jgi:hypothetical protein